MSDPVQVEARDDTTIIWLDRPERGNALDAAMVERLHEAVDVALARSARLIILRGRGRNFCTGLSLDDLDTASDGDLALRVIRIELLLQRLHSCPVSTMAVAVGRTFGAGADLFVACDYRVAVEGSSFSFPGPSFGLVLGTARLAARIGDDATRRLLLSGAVTPASDALRLGLATAVLEEAGISEAVDAAGAAARRLEPQTVLALHARTRRSDPDADLAALVRSAARPGLKERIQAYRAAAHKAKSLSRSGRD